MWPERQPRKSYPSDITDEQWAILAPLIPPREPSVEDGLARSTCAK